MRRLSLHMFITFDGYAHFPTYPGSNEPSTPEDDPVTQEVWVRHWPSIDTVILGRKSYEDWYKFWPPTNRKETDHPFLHQFSNFIDSTNKIVISNSLKTAEWNHTKIMNGNLTKIIANIRKEPGKNIAIGGGSKLAQEFMNLNLIDDYYLTVFPVILGNTVKEASWLFNNINNQLNLSLISVKPMKYGEFVIHYEALRNQ